MRVTAWTVTPGDDGVGTLAVTVQAPPVEGQDSAPAPRTFPSSIPAGTTLAHTYNGVNQTYNLAALTHWPSARARASSGGTYARLNVVGDSISYGAFNTPPYMESPPGQLLSLFANNGYGNGGTGLQMFYGPGVSAPDPRLAIGGFIDSAPGPVATAVTASTTPADFYLTPGISFDTYRLYYYGQPGGGTFTYQLNNGVGFYYPVVTVSTNKTAGWYVETNVAPPAGTTNTLFVNVVSGPVTFCAWEANLGNSGIRVGRLAEPGMTAHNVVPYVSPTFNLPGGAADLAVIFLGINDYGTQSLTFSADMTSLINAAQSAGSDVLLVVTQPSRTLLTKPQSDYSTILYNLADAKSCALLDIYDRWDPNVISDPSFYADSIIHPSNWGAADIANAIYTAVR